MSEDNFYQSIEWKRLRYQALKRYGTACQCCGAISGDPYNPIHVDHIKSSHFYPELALDITNIQVLCSHCNIGKGVTDKTDWRVKNKNIFIPNLNTFQKAKVCCWFIHDHSLGKTSEWYVEYVLLPLLGKNTDYLTSEQIGECFWTAFYNSWYYSLSSDDQQICKKYVNEQIRFHVKNEKFIQKTIGSLIWICKQNGMQMSWL